MPRELTPEHQAAMQAGRERKLAEDRAARLNAEAAYSAWVREDARLWAVYQGTDGRVTPAGEAAYRAWSANQREMPVRP